MNTISSNTNSVYSAIAECINNTSFGEELKCSMLQKLYSLRQSGVNIMITGATGSGKSSTINALFRADKARVGTGAHPETMSISRYDYEWMTLWDTPGLGDGEEADKRHAHAIIHKLNEKDEHGNMLIDAVLVVLDAGSRDLGTSYKLINEVIIPHIDKKERIVIALNQADMALKGRHWDHNTNTPEPPLMAALDNAACAVAQRVRSSTGINTTPIFYSAGYKEADGQQMPPYNLAKLLSRLLECIPPEKRLPVLDNLDAKKENYRADDGRANYKECVVDSFRQSGRAVGEAIGSVFGSVGQAVGGAIGEAVGGLVSKIFSWW